MPTIGHTRQQETAPTLTMSFARKIWWACADRVLHSHRTPVIVAAGTLHRNSDFTATRQSMREPIEHIGDRLPKPKPRPKLCSTHHRCQTAHSAPRARRLSNHTEKLPTTSPQAIVDSKMMPQRGERRSSSFIAQSKDLRFSLQSKTMGLRRGALGDASQKVSGTTCGCRRRRF
jgi:hypothetical protein